MTIKDELAAAQPLAKPVMANVDPALLESFRGDEQVLHAATISKGIFWKGIFFAVLSLLCFMSTALFNLGGFFALVAFITLTVEYLTKHYLMLVLTNKRVFVRYGIEQLDMVELRLNRIESVEVERPPMGRLLSLLGAGYGRVVISGTGSRVTVVPFVSDATAFRRALDRIVNERGMD